jgi:hypothetical protein
MCEKEELSVEEIRDRMTWCREWDDLSYEMAGYAHTLLRAHDDLVDLLREAVKAIMHMIESGLGAPPLMRQVWSEKYAPLIASIDSKLPKEKK